MADALIAICPHRGAELGHGGGHRQDGVALVGPVDIHDVGLSLADHPILLVVVYVPQIAVTCIQTCQALLGRLIIGLGHGIGNHLLVKRTCCHAQAQEK